MRILILGGGGREHAIAKKLSGSERVTGIVCAPGNGGTAGLATNIALDVEDPAAVAEYAKTNAVDLVVIGPEGPLVAGVADAVAAAGIRVFGPNASAARMEGSKEFAKALMRRHAIPTGSFATFTELEPALDYLHEIGAPIVVKADGLAAGKGVTVAMNMAAAEEAVHECLEGRFGEAGAKVLIEEFLEGPECSLLAFTDGKTVVPMVAVQDHKRVFDDDAGPNTGGMGAYTPVPAVDEVALRGMIDMLERTVSGLASEGVEFRGVLYGGFVLTDEGPKVLEYNARFGDPETQVILPMLATDLLDALLGVADGDLAGVHMRWRDGVCVTVVMAAGGYPGTYDSGKPITGIDDAEAIEGVVVYHAGTALAEDGRLVTAGGRVLNVTAVAPTFEEARAKAYAAVERISFEGAHYRRDIGVRALAAPPVDWAARERES
jgi:phosphoribosylamine--glycine ligase